MSIEKHKLAKELRTLRDKRSKVSEQYRELGKQVEEIETQLLTAMKQIGETKFTLAGLGTVSITSAVRPRIEDWHKFTKYVRRNNVFYLFEQRASVSGCRELKEQGKKIPGIDFFEKEGVRITKGK